MMELKETVSKMNSKDYKERFIAEYEQLCIRIIKLKKFVGKIKYAKYADIEEPKHDCPLDLLEKQLMAMMLYKVALKIRAEEFEHIELSKFDEDEE